MIDAETAGLKTTKRELINFVNNKANKLLLEIEKKESKIFKDSAKLWQTERNKVIKKGNDLLKKHGLNLEVYEYTNKYKNPNFLLPNSCRMHHKSFSNDLKTLENKKNEIIQKVSELEDRITLYGVSPEIVKLIEKAFK